MSCSRISAGMVSPPIVPAAAIAAYFAFALCPPALEAAAVCGRADDRVQFLQPWHAGHLSHLPAEAAWLRSRHGVADRGALQYRRDRRRADLRRLEPAFRPPAHLDRSAALLARAGGLSLGLFEHRGAAGAGRVPDAVLGAGRLGRGAGASERVVAAGCARHLSRHGLSAGQSDRVGECGAADRHRRTHGRQLRHALASVAIVRRAGDRGLHEVRAGSARCRYADESACNVSPGEHRFEWLTP